MDIDHSTSCLCSYSIPLWIIKHNRWTLAEKCSLLRALFVIKKHCPRFYNLIHICSTTHKIIEIWLAYSLMNFIEIVKLKWHPSLRWTKMIVLVVKKSFSILLCLLHWLFDSNPFFILGMVVQMSCCKDIFYFSVEAVCASIGNKCIGWLFCIC